MIGTIALTVSELASNCVRHTGDGFQLTIIRGDDEIRVEATDRGTRSRGCAIPRPTDLSGRGLQSIDMLAAKRGFDR